MHYILIFIFIFIPLFAESALQKKALDKGLKPIPSDFKVLKSQVDDVKNPMTIPKILLGKKLFFDKNLSKDRTIACASCHDIKKGGEDSIPTAIGYKELKNPSHLNTPTILNTAYSKHLFWDARASSLREQAGGPMQAAFEMASTPELVQQRVQKNPEYKTLFEKAYKTKDSITFENITKAIAVYEKTLVTRGAFDRYLEGDDSALNEKAKKGLNLFIDLGCKGCHYGSAVGGQGIQQFPLRDYNSIIELTSTYHEESNTREITKVGLNFEMYHPFPFKNIGGFMGKDGNKKFRVPILRNISKTAPYFHNGVVKNLRDAIALMSTYQIGVELTELQLDDMEEFLKSLDGEIVDFNLEF